MIGAGWRPTVDNYFRSVTKSRILVDVTDAKGSKFAQMIDHLKKAEVAPEAERLLKVVNCLPVRPGTPGRQYHLLSESVPATLPAYPALEDPDAAEECGQAAESPRHR